MSSSRAQARLDAARRANSRRIRQFTRPQNTDGSPMRTSEFFACNTFHFDVMEKYLPAADVTLLKNFATATGPLPRALAEKVAAAVKDWAISHGATHFCHWFQPQTGVTAEKHDSFFAFDSHGRAIEQFGLSHLIQAEPDASSFPSGGVRATFEARGYTAWDASSPMFLMETHNGVTLCIPSVFISYSGEALDEKTPLLRSIRALSDQAVAALELLGASDIKYVAPTAGAEQEYFIVDSALHGLRADLSLTGRSLFGKTPPRHQQLEDHYFGHIKPRVLSMMMEVEQELYKLGVPVKTRHNEVAPSQFELAPIFEHANVAADHNQIVMEVVEAVARRHQLVALFHEKPFAGVNGSGKHVNWSMADSNGQNLLEPGENPHENLRFLYFFTAIVKAVHDHGALLRMAIATPGNDFRLGANEAPPAIISTFLGDTMNEVMQRLEGGGKVEALSERAKSINLDLARVPEIRRDNTDRNRTSPFAFTGNKFEFRAVGASASISMPITMVNSAVAHTLANMNKRLATLAQGGRPSSEQVLAVIAEVARETKNIRFEGDNYSEAWHAEAAARGLPNLRTTPDALKVLKDEKVQTMLADLGVLDRGESRARYNVRLERFIKVRLIEMECMNEQAATHVVPAAFAYQQRCAEAISAIKAQGITPASVQIDYLKRVCEHTNQLLSAKADLDRFLGQCAHQNDEEALAESLADKGMALMNTLRLAINDLESIVDDDLWSLPKYRELLYLL